MRENHIKTDNKMISTQRFHFVVASLYIIIIIFPFMEAFQTIHYDVSIRASLFVTKHHDHHRSSRRGLLSSKQPQRQRQLDGFHHRLDMSSGSWMMAPLTDSLLLPIRNPTDHDNVVSSTHISTFPLTIVPNFDDNDHDTTMIVSSSLLSSSSSSDMVRNNNHHIHHINDALTTSATSSNADVATTIPLYQLAAAGCLTTCFADVCMHPMDSMKTILQSDLGYGLSIIQAGQYLWDQGGLSAFYSGFLTYGIADGVGGAIKFTVWELWKQRIMEHPILNKKQNTENPSQHLIHTKDDDIMWIKTLLLWIGAALSFIVSSVVIVPGELIKQQLQMLHYDTLYHAVTNIYHDHGILGFFVGYEGVFYRDVPYTMIELGLYEVLKNSIQNFKRNQQQSSLSSSDGMMKGTSTIAVDTWDESSTETTAASSSLSSTTTTSWYEEIGAAAITGAISSFCTTPLDTIKTKLMVNQELYPNFTFLDCFFDTIDTYGMTSIFAGVTARMAWIIPFTILYLPTYDYLKRLLQQHHDNKQQETSSNNNNDEMTHTSLLPFDQKQRQEKLIATTTTTAFAMTVASTNTFIEQNVKNMIDQLPLS